MSQPRDPYRGGPQRPYGAPQPYGDRQQYGAAARYGPPQERYRPQPPQYPPRPEPERRARRIPGIGLLLTLLGLVIQVLSLTVLPWLVGGRESVSMPTLWDAATDSGTADFGGLYVALLSYPLAALGVVLALATVLDSVVLKVLWGGLMVVGLGALVLRYGFGPLADSGLEFTTRDVTVAVVAAAVLVVVIFLLRTAMSMFRRVAALILIVFAGVHVAAVVDLVRGSGADLGIGAFGPAVGYVLIAVAAIIGPRRLPGV
jgi:hypothetical protein